MTTKLTDTQYTALDTAARRGDTHIYRDQDATEATLRALASKHLAELVHELRGARKVVTAARITRYGWLTWSEEADRRAGAQRAADRARVAAVSTLDPFAVYANSPEARFAAQVDAAFEAALAG